MLRLSNSLGLFPHQSFSPIPNLIRGILILLTSSPTPPVLYAFSTADEVSKKLAEFVIAAQNDALNKRSAFKLAISGGSLAATLAKHLVGNDRVQWEKWYVV